MSGTVTLPKLRHLTAADRDRIEEISRAVGVFHDDEIPVALEVFDGAIAGSAAAGSPDYLALGADVDGRLAGWICWGPTPCTLGTFDLYWMAVDPAHHGAGIGTALLNAMEQRLRRHGPARRRGDGRTPGLRPDPRLLRGPRVPGGLAAFRTFYAPGR